MSSCEFCDAFGGTADDEFVRRAGPGPTRVLPVTAGVAVFPSLAPLSAFHALVSPVEHVLSTAAASDRVSASVWRIAAELRAGLAAHGADAVLFEHGLPRAGGAGCGVSHAHVHVAAVPSASQLRLPVGPWFEHRGNREQIELDPDAEYLLVGLAPDNWAWRYQSGIPSQYLRRWIASELDSSNWDWRQATDRDRDLRAQRAVIEDLLGGRRVPAIAGRPGSRVSARIAG